MYTFLHLEVDCLKDSICNVCVRQPFGLVSVGSVFKYMKVPSSDYCDTWEHK